MAGEIILVVEDETKIADFIRRGLIYEGYQAQVANDGLSALSVARDTPPDLVVLDVMLPGLDGLEVCRRLRAGSDVPILMLTARDAVRDRVAGWTRGRTITWSSPSTSMNCWRGCGLCCADAGDGTRRRSMTSYASTT